MDRGACRLSGLLRLEQRSDFALGFDVARNAANARAGRHFPTRFFVLRLTRLIRFIEKRILGCCVARRVAVGAAAASLGITADEAAARLMAAGQVQDLYLAKDYAGAGAAVPFEFIDRTSLIGPPERVRDRLSAFAEAGVTTLTVAAYSGTLQERVATLRTMAEVLEASGLAS